MTQTAKLRVLVAAAGVAALAVVGAASAARATASATHQVFYSVATSEQYVNNKDDRARGQGANPFGNFHDATPTTQQAKGPFPGDESVFQFKVYSSPKLGKTVGSAQYICLYNFNHNVFCDASYDLPGGTVAGSGAFSFDASRFTISVTGGTGHYSNLRGDLEVAPAANHAQRLTFTLG